MMLFLSAKSNVNQKEGPLSPQSSLKSAKVDPMKVQKGPFSYFVLNENTLNEETIWCLNVVSVSQVLKSLVIVVNLVIH